MNHLEENLGEFSKDLDVLLDKYCFRDHTSIPNKVMVDLVINTLKNIFKYEEEMTNYYPTSEEDSMDGDAESALKSVGWGVDEDYESNLI